MHRRIWNGRRFIAFILCAGLLALPAAFAGEKPAAVKDKAKTAGAEMSPEEMMAAYAKYAQPGPQHQILGSMAGNWKTVVKAWMAPGDPQVSEGRCTTSAILGGRYIKEEVTGSFMNQPFEGFGITGYDVGKKEFVGAWTDTMGTGIMFSRGSIDPTGKVLTMIGTFDDPLSGKKQTMKEVTRIVDANKHIFEIWENREGKEVKSMEITYTRE